jgi:hypothetical protein
MRDRVGSELWVWLPRRGWNLLINADIKIAGPSYRTDRSRPTLPTEGTGVSDRYEGEPAAVVIARRAYSLGRNPLRAR